MSEYIVQIDFVDRPGLGYEIFALTEHNGIDKIAMEVIPALGMFLQFQCGSQEQADTLLTELKALNGIKSVKFRSQMPYQEREDALRTILDSVSEGVLAIDGEGKISHINEVACKIFRCRQEDVLGQDIESLLGDQPSILETLHEGKVFRLQEGKICRNGAMLQFLASSVPVKNDKGQIIGAVSTVQDFRQVEKVILQSNRLRRLTTFDDIVYQSKAMDKLIHAAKTVAKSSSTILLRGESGTGKEMIATAIHSSSLRYRGPFIAINCTALTDTLLESELFGYEEGAFTGAVKGGKKGLFEQADGGTLFLDEVGDISPRLQVQLLRVLQAGTIRRVGGQREISVDVRIIAATHRNLEEMIRQEQFREDLYYRLNVIPLTLPPLRQRREDVLLLAQHLIRKICAKLNKPEFHLAKESLKLLVAQEWPGNVRQLENTLERLVNLSGSVEISPEDLLAWTDITDVYQPPKNITKKAKMLEVRIPFEDEWPQLKDIVAQVEREILSQVLEKYPSSRLAGQVLGVSNTTILNKMKVYNL